MGHVKRICVLAAAIGCLQLSVTVSPVMAGTSFRLRSLEDYPNSHDNPQRSGAVTTTPKHINGAKPAVSWQIAGNGKTRAEEVQELVDKAIMDLLHNPVPGESSTTQESDESYELEGYERLPEQERRSEPLALLHTEDHDEMPEHSSPARHIQNHLSDRETEETPPPICQSVRPKKVKVMAGKININTASAEYLSMLPGIGLSKAQAIVNYRERKPFKQIRHIIRVKGMTWKHYSRIKDYLATDQDSDFHHEIYPPGYVANNASESVE